MRDLNIDELGQVYGAGGNSRCGGCGGGRGSKSRGSKSHRSKSHKSKSHKSKSRKSRKHSGRC